MKEIKNVTEMEGSPRQRPAGKERLRVIVTTDGEGDDQCSMIRYLLYANEWETFGLIHSSSKHHWQGDADHEPYKWQGTTWIDEQLDRYEQVYPSLIRHDAKYPSPANLHKQVFVGNVAYEGEMVEATPGSDRIVEVLLDDDPRPVWLQAWGGPNTIARALKTIADEHPERVAEVSRKAKIFMVANQDPTYDQYISHQWPDVLVIQSSAYHPIAYRWRQHLTAEQQTYFEHDWLEANLLGKGPLLELYRTRGGHFLSEGDSVAFLHLIDVGLRSGEDPGFGGWGGRFVYRDGRWRSADDDGDRNASVGRWTIAFQNDFAARADRCVKPPDQVNHPPAVVLAHDADLSAKPDEMISLSAEATSDPDDDALTYSWWVYAGPSTYPGAMSITGADQPQAQLRVPADIQPGQTIHVICEVTDNGTPPLTRYRGVIVACEY